MCKGRWSWSTVLDGRGETDPRGVGLTGLLRFGLRSSLPPSGAGRKPADRDGAAWKLVAGHVQDKDDVLSGIVDLVFAEIELPHDDADWRAFMRARAISARAVLGRHPWAIGLLDAQTRPGPENLRHHDRVLGALLGAGFSSRMATHAYSLVDSYVYGFALQERSMPVATPETAAASAGAILAQVSPDRYPNLVSVGRELVDSDSDYGAEFELGLDLILDGLARLEESA